MIAIKTASLLSILLTLGWTGNVSARPAGEPRVLKRSPLTGGDLRMIPSTKFRAPGLKSTSAGGGFGLKQTGQWFFGQDSDVPFAMLVGDAANHDTRFLTSAEFSDSLKEVNCDGDSVDLTFDDLATLQSAQREWGWLSEAQAQGRSIVFVGDATCSHADTNLYLINTIQYDEVALTAKMDGVPTQWKESFGNYTLRIDSYGIDAEATLSPAFQAQLHKRDQDGKFGSLEVPTFGAKKNKDKGNNGGEGNVPVYVNLAGETMLSVRPSEHSEVTVRCHTCSIEGGLHFKVDIDGVLDPQISVEFDASDLAVNLGLGLKVAGRLDFDKSQTLPPIPLIAPLGISGLASIGPQVVVGVAATFGLEASLEVAPLGGRLTFPNGPVALVGINKDQSPDQSGWGPEFEFFSPEITGQIQGTAALAPFFALGFNIDVAGFGASAGLIADVPRLALNFKAAVSTGAGICDNPNAHAGISFNATIGGELNLFAGAEPIEEAHGLKVVKLVDIAQPIFEKCYPIDV
jgi:hypothetical protein